MRMAFCMRRRTVRGVLHGTAAVRRPVFVPPARTGAWPCRRRDALRLVLFAACGGMAERGRSGFIRCRDRNGMARGYSAGEMRRRVLDILAETDVGMSGVEISTRLGISRITATKYLGVFAAQGMISSRNIGNTTLWTASVGTEAFKFPDDYFRVRTLFLDGLSEGPESRVYGMLRNCIDSGARVQQLVLEVILPAVSHVRALYDEAKIGDSELGMLEGILLNSVKLVQQRTGDAGSGRNAILIAADGRSLLKCQCAEAAYRSRGWRVCNLGDMSRSMNVMLDIDLTKFLGRIWRPPSGVMILVVFSETEASLGFFADAVDSSRARERGNLFLVLCGGAKSGFASDLTADDLESVLQWSETVFENSTA